MKHPNGQAHQNSTPQLAKKIHTLAPLILIIFFLPSTTQASRAPVGSLSLDDVNRHHIIDKGFIQGEHIDNRTGNIYWETTDLKLPGNGGLDLHINRSFAKGTDGGRMHIGNWELEIPRIVMTQHPHGYSIGEYGRSTLCQTPEPVDAPSSGHHMPRPDLRWWSGLKLIIPGEGPRTLLFKASTATQYPVAVKYVTTDHWIAECISSKGSVPNGFLVTAPNGTQYLLDQLVRDRGTLGGDLRRARNDKRRIRYMTFARKATERRTPVVGKITVLASKVTDRNGNTLT